MVWPVTAIPSISSVQSIAQPRLESFPAISYRVAVVQWSDDDGIAEVIRDELTALGHRAESVRTGSSIPRESDVAFFFGPYGRSLPALSLLGQLPAERRPICVYWNTEPVPDLRLSWNLARTIGACRSWVDRLGESHNHRIRSLVHHPLSSSRYGRMRRFLYLGDYYYAYRKGWIDILADSSALFARIRSEHGLPTLFAPWGATPRWYADLRLERDIDVLWMGARATKRRHRILDKVCGELRAHGIRVHIADNVENPFIFDEERIQFLNRAKITLNLVRRWHDDNFSRFAMAVPNRSLVISEPLLPHCPHYEPGIHYISAPVEKLTNTILYYINNERERLQIVESAYKLVTTALTLQNSIKVIMDAVDKVPQTPR
jgi:hypothetical protein